MEKNTKKVSILVTFLLLVCAALVTGQKFLFMIPLFVSLFVMALQSEANRFGYLIGGINSLIYAAVYVFFGLYATAINCVIISFPLQILTFIFWNKRKYKKSVLFKKMSAKTRLMLTVLFFAVWLVSFSILVKNSSIYALLDSFTSVLGTIVSVLTLLAFIEYSYLALISCISGIALHVQLVVQDPSQLTYLIYACYSFYCTVFAFFTVRKLYAEQRKPALEDQK